MSNNLTSAIVQLPITWHDPEANISTAHAELSKLKNVDLVVLPEMWSSGFTMFAHKYYNATPQALQVMKEWSSTLDACIVGSLITKENDQYYNRMYAVINGEVSTYYDKKHLFGLSGEDRFYRSGDQRVILEYKSWRINLNVCYDLRFPVWCRNCEDYDIAVFSSNWPDKRIEAWNILLQARAIENLCYILGANCYGEDVWHNTYQGHSAIIQYDGKVIISLKEVGGTLVSTLQKDTLISYRKSLPFLKDGDRFKLI
ncbi:nitrilase family protein [Saprospiraceae bacterium]|nr:nitrilase family protein [Saprospiraceae bacterium]